MNKPQRRLREAAIVVLRWTMPLFVAALPACKTPDPEPLTFHYHLISAPSTLDPARTADFYSDGVIDRLFDGLMRLDRVRNEPVRELAESYTQSDDGRVYDFHLVRGARFHNGRPIRAADFKYSWERVLAPETDSPRAWLFELIEGADDFHRGEAESVSGIEVVGSHRLRVRLKTRFAPFLYHLAVPAAAVVPAEEVRRLGNDFARRPVGSGPYRFVGWEEGVRVELAAFHGHVHHSPQVERLVYEIVPDFDEALRRFQAGELDLVSAIPPGSLRSLQQTFSSDLYFFPGSLWFGFCFRCDQKPFDDPRVRRALSLAVERDVVVRELGELEYLEAEGFLPQGIPGHDPATPRPGHDLKRARALLSEAGYPGGKGFPEQVYTTRTGEVAEKVAKLLVDAFSALGIAADHRAMDFSSLLEARKEGRLALFRQSWGGEYPDPEPYFRPLFHSRGSDNAMAYANPEVDRLLDAARVEGDADERLALYRRAEELILHDAPCVSLYQMTETILLRPRWKNIPVGYGPELLEIELARIAREVP